MEMEYVYKEPFTVVGKLGEGPAENPWKWIQPIWDSANSNFPEIASLVKTDQSGKPKIWGIMSDFSETFSRWDEKGGKYLACCETETEVRVPEGWVKWTVPGQTYLTVKCKQEEYLEVFNSTIHEYIPGNQMQLVGAVHEQYPEPGNPEIVVLYFPIAKGNYFCQSCGMPMNRDEDHGTNQDGSYNEDYCCYCYKDGGFGKEESMEEMIETCIPFELEAGRYPDAKTAREALMSYFPKLKRWKTC